MRPSAFFEDVPLLGFMYPVFTRKPGGVTVGDSGLCHCCVLCLLDVADLLDAICFECCFFEVGLYLL